MADGRIPCLVKGCRRTAPADKYDLGTQIICAKCWRALVPIRLKRRYKALARVRRRLERRFAQDEARIDRVEELQARNWNAIRRAVNNPQGPPAGLEQFMKDAGLR